MLHEAAIAVYIYAYERLDIFRTLSTTAARASSGCLLGRLAKVGESHRVAAKRRAWAKREGERLEEERRAHWRAHVQGRGVMRGEFVYTI